MFIYPLVTAFEVFLSLIILKNKVFSSTKVVIQCSDLKKRLFHLTAGAKSGSLKKIVQFHRKWEAEHLFGRSFSVLPLAAFPEG